MKVGGHPDLYVRWIYKIFSSRQATMTEFQKLKEQLRHPDNPIVFLDISAGGVELGRVKIELFADVVPKTAENFRF